MAAFSQRKAVLCTFNRFSGRFCFLHSMSGRNTQREFYNVTSYPPKKELTEVGLGELENPILLTRVDLCDRGFSFERSCVLRRWESETLK